MANAKTEGQREWSKKPFLMPPDEEVFRIRSLDRKQREKRILKNMFTVAEKTTFVSRMAATVASEELKKELDEIDKQVSREIEQLKDSKMLPIEHYHKEKENMAEFIAKKREIFLVQMSLDNKKTEVRKLQERALQREEALKKSEEMLVEDKLQFEAFLKQNDQKVQEAIKRAEQQTKLKQEKLAEIKRLNAAIATIKKDLNKFQEQLDECKKYKDFLMGLTPLEWLDKKVESQVNDMKENESKGGSETGQLRKEMHVMLKGNEDNEEQELEEAETNIIEPMYFKSPQQLLEIYADLEERNLALMQESQDIESALEDLKTRFSDTKAKIDSKMTNLQSQLGGLILALKNEEERQRNLQPKTNVNMVDKKYDVSSEELTAKVTEVYERCGLEFDPSLGIVQMLTSIEAKLEESVIVLDGIPGDQIEQVEKAHEKQRRLKLREDKLEKQRVEQEKRAERSLERAHAPIFKRTVKPQMFRSYLHKKKKQEIQVVRTDDDKELMEFLARDF